jgi:26S proteasome regulatory subunit T6
VQLNVNVVQELAKSDYFHDYREHAPSIIFMDEIDSIGSARIESSGGGDSEVQRTMLELLNQLDGFEPTKNIKVC